MDELIAFLNARLDEDEAAAKAAWRGDGWRHENMPDEVWTGRSAPGHTPIPIAKAWDQPTAEHIARHDPARVLADVAAKRAVIAACAHNLEYEDYGYTLAERVLRALALPYAEHEDYKPHWRPRDE